MRITSPILARDFKSSFLSVEKNQEIIWRKLFIENKPYSDYLKRLLVINTKDCLDETNYQYKRIIDNTNISDLIENQYLRVVPKIEFGEHEEQKTYIILEFDDFLPSENPEFRNCTISFTILAPLDKWDLNDYKLRPHQIAGYIDGILDNSKLSGIGTLQFMGASQILISEYYGGILLRYQSTNGSDDTIPVEEEK